MEGEFVDSAPARNGVYGVNTPWPDARREIDKNDGQGEQAWLKALQLVLVPGSESVSFLDAMSALSARVLLALLALTLLPASASAQIQQAIQRALMQQTHAIGLALFSYATDNNGAYPTGKSSTEVFQKLIDGGYVSDPSIFYSKMPGKVPPTSNKLKPENVSFDVTVPIDSNSSDMVPVLFTTGFKISYAPGSSAVPVSDAAKQAPGISIFYKGNSAVFIPKAADGSAPNAISPNLNDAGHYQQLTPDGPLQVMT
jgi:type II secretory pathway pseudopilin PulG